MHATDYVQLVLCTISIMYNILDYVQSVMQSWRLGHTFPNRHKGHRNWYIIY